MWHELFRIGLGERPRSRLGAGAARRGGGGAGGRARPRPRRLRGVGAAGHVDAGALRRREHGRGDPRRVLRRGGRARRAGLGGRVARVPPSGPGGWPLDRAAVGGARPRRARGRDRSGPRVRNGRPPDDEALRRAAREGGAWLSARRRLRLGGALDRRGASRLRARSAPSTTTPLPSRRRSPTQRSTASRSTRALLDGESDELPPPTSPSRTCCSPRWSSILARLDARAAITSGYLASDHPATPGWRLVERLELDGWAADRLARIP